MVVCLPKIKGFNLIKTFFLIWLSEKNKIRTSWRKSLFVQNVEIESFGLIFSLKYMFLLLHRVKYRNKKVPLGTCTEFQVPILVPYWFKCERYPTLLTVQVFTALHLFHILLRYSLIPKWIKIIIFLKFLQTILHNDNVKEVCLKSLQMY